MIKIIINPDSEEVLTNLAKIEQYFKEKNIVYEISSNIVKSEMQSIDKLDIIVIGGDGTINKVINTYSNCNIVYLPSGSGNDLGKSLDLPIKVEDIYNTLVYGEIKTYDLGCANGEKFLSGFDVGFNADIIRLVANSKYKKYFKKHVYFLYGLKRLAMLKNYSAKIKIDDDYIETSKLRMLNVMVQPFEGGGIKFAENATGRGGKLHIMIMKDMNLLVFIYNYLCLLLNKQNWMKNVIKKKATEVEIFCNQPYYQIDGEIRENNNKITIGCIENGYKIREKGEDNFNE